MRYVDGVPSEEIGGAALYGSVIHDALQHWALNRSQNLSLILESSWLRVTSGDEAGEAITQLLPLIGRAKKLSQQIVADRASAGTETKNVRATKAWKDSGVAQELAGLDKLEESKWRFAKNKPLPVLYADSLNWAEEYEPANNDLPTALQTEFRFNVPFRGFDLHGMVDAIRPVLSLDPPISF